MCRLRCHPFAFRGQPRHRSERLPATRCYWSDDDAERKLVTVRERMYALVAVMASVRHDADVGSGTRISTIGDPKPRACVVDRDRIGDVRKLGGQRIGVVEKTSCRRIMVTQ